MTDDLRIAIQKLISEAIAGDFYTADARRVMLPIDALIELGCANEFDRIDIRVAINKFNERNQTEEGTP